MITGKFHYDAQEIPSGYACSCGASGVRLYRQYGMYADHTKLLCRACSMFEQDKDVPALSESELSIGWRVAAVPTEDGEAYWGHTSIPQTGIDWWMSLPKQVQM